MNKKQLLRYFMLLVGLVLLSACGQTASQKTQESTKDLKIVTTFFPMYDFTRNVVGNDQSIELLIDGSIEPHDFEPSAKDIAKIQDADVFIYNSVEMETWVPAVLASIDTSKVKVIEASEGIELLAGDSHGHNHDHGHEEDQHGEEGHGEAEHDHSGLHLHGVADHYHTGDTVTVEAHGFAEFNFEQFQWLVKKGDNSFEPLNNQAKAEVSFEIAESSQLVLNLLATDGSVVAETEPVALMVDNHDEHDEHGGHDHHHEHDPHVWLDPNLVKKEVATIAKGLSEVNPEQKATYEKNSQAYQQKLTDLDQDFETTFDDAKNRQFITQHTAFAYLAKRYDLEQIGISGLSPDLEPTAKELAEIESFVKEHQISIIFTEDIASPKIAETIASATGATLETLSPIEGITAQEMEDGVDYIEVMERNLRALELVIK